MAQIELAFFDDVELNHFKNVCEDANRRECKQEKNLYTQEARQQDINSCMKRQFRQRKLRSK